ncbi:hypothetical protein ACIA48_12450 [Mycobacterium sp. NPDC051804]|uniref:DUF7159 family protein n=1 Tax=Mycobacterium sp. NPDC051804 TaxID=3364295 RepID=UPI00378DD36C
MDVRKGGMDAVLGLSVTPSAVGLVLVEGQDADGSTVDREAFEIVSGRHSTPFDTSEKAAAAVLRTEAIAANRGQRLHSIGVTWSDGADAEASLLLKSLNDNGFDNVVPIRLPEATEALAWGIAEVIGYDVTAVCVIEPDTVITLIVHAGEGAVQTAVNHAIDSEEDLLRWLSAVFTRADWQPEALVVVGSGSDRHRVVPRLEGVLGVPVFVPAESELALARGAALASAHNTEFMQIGRTPERAPRERRRRLAQTGPLAMLAVGAVTFVVSVSVAVSLEVTPERDVAAPEPRPAAKTSPDVGSAAVRAALPAAPREAIPAPIAESPLPPPEAPPIEPPAAAPVDIPEALPADGLAPEAAADAMAPEAPVLPPPVAPIEALAPGAAPPAPGLIPAQPTPVQQRRGLLTRIRDRLSNIGGNDEAPAAQQAPAPAPAGAPPVPGAPAPLPEGAAPPPDAAVPPPGAPPLLPPQ